MPSGSQIDTIVLLKELLMCATPKAMFLRSLRRGRRVPDWLCHYFFTFFLPATVRFGSLAGARVGAGALTVDREALGGAGCPA